MLWLVRRGRRSSAWWDRTVTSLLLVALVAASSLLVLSYSFLRTPSTLSSPSSSESPGDSNSTGTLMIVVLLGPGGAAGANRSGGQTVAPVPLDPVNYTAVRVGSSGTLLRLLLRQPGEETVRAKTGFYSIVSRNKYYNVSASADLTKNAVTEVDVTVTESGARVSFSSLSDPDNSEVVSPWEPITVQTAGSATPIRPGQLILLGLAGPSGGCAATCGYPVGGTVRTKVLSADVRSTGTWVVVVPLQSIPVPSFQPVAVVSVNATCAVRSLGA